MMMKHCIFNTIGIAAALFLGSCKPAPPTAAPATPVEIGQRIANAKAPLTLVHVWATWCDPCREEFPELVNIHHTYAGKGLELILVSADDPAATAEVEAFVAEHGSPVGSLVATELNQAFIETLSPDWGGALPASFFFKGGKIVSEWEGKRTYEEYAQTIETLLKP
ncbi:Thiol-disulfide oxidoreductase ResA [Pontiella desulfatans]|uniref:Thiol-disulfide oxidoreductase ResA n=1 Tax=Pontiella desulfatans TaxID=2750659 RepID=A0A6C2U8B6_PONDE|nr:TlpA disulfide reductase family protein [Pontiella desulfatans]VGO16063.1 Thiol-disulfide oxidoreductase ResA [Pontiella desulfatans]